MGPIHLRNDSLWNQKAGVKIQVLHANWDEYGKVAGFKRKYQHREYCGHRAGVLGRKESRNEGYNR